MQCSIRSDFLCIDLISLRHDRRRWSIDNCVV